MLFYYILIFVIPKICIHNRFIIKVPPKLKRGVSVPKFQSPTSILKSSNSSLKSSDSSLSPPPSPSSSEPKISKRKSVKLDIPVEAPQEEEQEERKANKFQNILDEMLGVAIYVDYRVKKLMETEIEQLRDMQEKLCCALLEKGKVAEELEVQNKNLQKQLQEVTMERDILRKKLEFEREYSRIIVAIDEQ